MTDAPRARNIPAGADPAASTGRSSERPGRTLVIIPTYNEASNIVTVLDQTIKLDRVDALIIDDGSPDGTADAVRSIQEEHPDRVHLIERGGKLGFGSAYLRGYGEALKRDYQYICSMDADLSHDPADLPRLIDPVHSGNADLVVGSRYAQGVRVINWPLRRLVLSYGAGVYTRTITRLPVMDVTAGFMCFHRRVLESLDLERVNSDGYSFLIEMKYRAWRAGFRVAEVPIIFTERTEGQSKMSRAIFREAVWKVWELRLRDIIGRL